MENKKSNNSEVENSKFITMFRTPYNYFTLFGGLK